MPQHGMFSVLYNQCNMPVWGWLWLASGIASAASPCHYKHRQYFPELRYHNQRLKAAHTNGFLMLPSIAVFVRKVVVLCPRKAWAQNIRITQKAI